MRATEGSSRPRIKLTREDAENLLRQTHPACVVALNPNTGPVAFRFLDDAFSKALEEFLRSNRTSMTLRLKEMDTSLELFDRTLRELRRPGAQYRLRIESVRRQLSQTFPGSDLSIESSGVGALNAFVNVPWIGSIFEVSRTRGDTVRNLVFETGQLPNSRFRRKHSTRNSRGQ